MYDIKTSFVMPPYVTPSQDLISRSWRQLVRLQYQIIMTMYLLHLSSYGISIDATKRLTYNIWSYNCFINSANLNEIRKHQPQHPALQASTSILCAKVIALSHVLGRVMRLWQRPTLFHVNWKTPAQIH